LLLSWPLSLGIDRYGVFGADADISVIHGPAADIDVFYGLPFFQELQKSGFTNQNFSNCSNFN